MKASSRHTLLSQQHPLAFCEALTRSVACSLSPSLFVSPSSPHPGRGLLSAWLPLPPVDCLLARSAIVCVRTLHAMLYVLSVHACMLYSWVNRKLILFLLGCCACCRCCVCTVLLFCCVAIQCGWAPPNVPLISIRTDPHVRTLPIRTSSVP